MREATRVSDAAAGDEVRQWRVMTWHGMTHLGAVMTWHGMTHLGAVPRASRESKPLDVSEGARRAGRRVGPRGGRGTEVPHLALAAAVRVERGESVLWQ